jgi:hypothetical protein
MTDLHDAVDVGSLIAFGLGGRNPSEGSDYGRIFERYRTDAAFKDLVDAVASGLGLSVLGAPPSGIVLAAGPGSPFSFRLSDLGLGTEDQQVFGLVLLGVAALAYPTEAQLDATSAQIVSVERIERFIRSAIGPLKSVEPIEGSFEARTASAARVYEARPAFIPTKIKKDAAKGCTQWSVEQVLDWLTRQRMAREAGRAYGVGRFFLTDRFRVMVGELAGSEALEVLRSLGREARLADGEASV